MVSKKYYLRDLDARFKESESYFEYYEISLEEDYHVNDFARPGIFIIPGGAYAFVSVREGTPVALSMLCEGFNAFVMKYTVNKKYPTPHLEVGFAINYIREHYKEFHLLDMNLSICGFSAGGHLAASFSYLYKELADSLHVNEKNLRPFSVILGYPVITTDDYTHEMTRDIITGKDKSLYQKLSVEKNITDDYPPTYIFSTIPDSAVPIRNSYEMIEQLKIHRIPYKSDIFENGEHGGSIYLRGCYQNDFGEGHKKAIDNSIWIRHASDFIYGLIENKKY